MAKNHKADISNKNVGTPGQNPANKAAQDNRANQINPKHAASKGEK